MPDILLFKYVQYPHFRRNEESQYKDIIEKKKWLNDTQKLNFPGILHFFWLCLVKKGDLTLKQQRIRK